MPSKYRLPLLFFVSLFILVFSVNAVHGPSPAHARRSLAFKKKSHRQFDNVFGNVIGDLLGGVFSSTPEPTSSTSTSSSPTSSPTTNPSTLPTNTDPPSTSTTPSSSDTPSTTPPSSTSTTPSSSDSPSTTPPPSTSTTPSSSDTPSTTPPPSTSDTPSSSLPTTTSTPSTTNLGSSSPSSSPTPDTPTSTPPTTTPASSSPSPTSSIPPNCLVDLLGNCVSLSSSSPPVSSTSSTPVTTSTTPTPSSPSSSHPDPPTNLPQHFTPTSSTPPTSSSDTPTPTSTPDCPLGVVVGGVCVLPSTSTPPASSSNPPPSTSPPSTTPDLGQSSSSPSPTIPNPESSSPPTPTPTSSSPVDPCGPVGMALGLCSSNSSPPASTSPLTSAPPPSPSPSPSSSSTPPLTTSPSPPVDPCGDKGIALGLCTPSVVPSSATSSQPPSQFTDPCDSVGIAHGLCPTSSSPPSSPSSSPPAIITPPQSCGPLDLCSSTTTPDSETQIPSGTVPSSGTPPESQSQPSLSTGKSSSPSGVPSDSSSGSSLSPIPVISFPSGINNNLSSTSSFSLTATNDRPFPALTPPPQTQLSYVTVTSLLLAPSVTSSFSDTLSDPDAVPTLTFATPSNSSPTPTPVNLPPDLPARIYPPEQVDINSLSGFTLISLLFGPALSWPFVARSSQVQGELFLWAPVLVANALDINSTQVMTFALQVFVPDDYRGPQDVDRLLTTYLMYIPTPQVAVLANEIRVASSPFYTKLGEPYRTLAAQVNSAFPVTAIQDPNAVPGSTSSVTPSKNKSRTDVIIGVTSALGGLALGALGVLVYRSVKRSRDLRHRRLADTNAPSVPYPDRIGRDFDQDSIGGQRRRSFYFAEDSLRGQEAVQRTAVPVAQPQGQHVIQPVSQVEYSYRTSPDGVRERRAPVVTGAISAPILTQSSLNW